MPKVVVIAGPNGAGKSTSAPTLLREALAVHEFVNADGIALGLSGFAPESVAFAAGRLMLRRLHALANKRQDFAFETTLASRSFASWLASLQSSGYEVHLAYLWLPKVELAVQRVAERVGAGGHDIPKDVIVRRYEKSLKNFFNLYSPFADSWTMFDNSKHPHPDIIAWRHKDGPVFSLKGGPWNKLKARYERDSTE